MSEPDLDRPALGAFRERRAVPDDDSIERELSHISPGMFDHIPDEPGDPPTLCVKCGQHPPFRRGDVFCQPCIDAAAKEWLDSLDDGKGTTEDEDDGVVWMTDVEARPVRWLWTGRVPFGKVTIFEGEPEQGKSLVTCDLVARVTRGTVLPDGEQLLVPRNGLIVTAEDDYTDTVKPRLMAAGADMARVASYPLRRDPETGKVAPLTIPDDVNKLQRIIERHEFALVIIDPITAFLAEDVQTHNDASVRRALSPANLMAQETMAAIVLLRHLNKDSSKSAINRGGGSVAFSANSRAVWVFAPHPDDEDLHLMARTKNNLTPRGQTPALGYRIESRETPVGEQPIAAWQAGTYDMTADDLLKHDARTDAQARNEALEWLEQTLSMGPVPSAKLQEMAEAEGLSWSTVKRAKNASNGRFTAERMRDDGGKTVGWQWADGGVADVSR